MEEDEEERRVKEEGWFSSACSGASKRPFSKRPTDPWKTTNGWIMTRNGCSGHYR